MLFENMNIFLFIQYLYIFPLIVGGWGHANHGPFPQFVSKSLGSSQNCFAPCSTIVDDFYDLTTSHLNTTTVITIDADPRVTGRAGDPFTIFVCFPLKLTRLAYDGSF